MNGMVSDQYVSVDRSCPISTELETPGGVVMVNLGPRLGTGNTLRLMATDTETCLQLAHAWLEARDLLVGSRSPRSIVDESNMDKPRPVPA